MNESENIIYGLKDPRTDEYKYVGKSNNGLIRAKSYLGHSHNPLVMNWINGLKQDNYIPDIVILENVSDWTQLVDKEKYWIGKLINDGHDLLNILINESYDNIIEIHNKKLNEQIESRNKILNEKLNKSLIQFGTESDIGELIKGRRKILNITQEDLAEISGIGLKTLKIIESNKGNPTIKSITKILNTLGFEIFINLK